MIRQLTSAMPFRAMGLSGILAVAAVVAGFSALSTGALAASARVKVACANDYFAHCSSHGPDSPETRSCMRAVGAGLSHSCVTALIADGEVSAAEVAKRRAASKTASN